MSQNNHDMDEIDRILQEFQQETAERRKKAEKKQEDILPPPIRRDEVIDFADDTGDEEEEAEPKKSRKKIEIKKPEIKLDKEKLVAAVKAVPFKKVFNKKVMLSVFGVILAVVLVFTGIRVSEAVSKSRAHAYLKPYEEKYNIEFPDGMLEEYCDYYGENQKVSGFIEIKDTKLSSPVCSKKAKKYPSCELPKKGAKQGNFVVYLDDDSLEKLYSTADGYNNSSAEISYSDLFEKYSFRVVGAFYTNEKPEDDNGYVFPYNVAEKLTADSAASMADRVQSRLIYDVGITLTRGDRFIFVSCPTDYRENFRFVVVGVQRENMSTKLTAREKKESDIHYPQVIYDETETRNPYAFSNGWYPKTEK